MSTMASTVSSLSAKPIKQKTEPTSSFHGSSVVSPSLIRMHPNTIKADVVSVSMSASRSLSSSKFGPITESVVACDMTPSLSKLAPLEAVLFDIDGTLCDTDLLHYSVFREMLLEINFNGGVPITEEFYIQNIAAKHSDEVSLALFPNDTQRGLHFILDKEAKFRELASKQLKAIDGLYRVKKWIEDRGLKRAAVTNAPRPNAELMISKLGLSDFFDAVIIGPECEHAKPHPEPYLKALQVLNVSKHHTFIFEDSVPGIKAGVAAGVPVIGLTAWNSESLLMEAKPTFLINNYNDPKLWIALEELDQMQNAAASA